LQLKNFAAFDLPQHPADAVGENGFINKEAVMKAQDIMTQFVMSVGPNDAVSRAVRIMLQNEMSGLPVLDTFGRLVGMITEGDLMRRVEMATHRRRPRWIEIFMTPGRLAEEYVHSHGRKVSEIMTTDPVSVTEETPLEDVVAVMEKRRVKRVPVVRGDRVVGIVSRANLLHALAKLSVEAMPAQSSDRAIREQLLHELQGQKWAPTASVNITVRDGVVDLWGTITDDRERQALVVAAEKTPGVKAVNDHIVWIEPMSGLTFLAPEEASKVLPKAS
jgi:CBS domain-containing protein